MSALARYYHAFGSIISGSDKESSALINELISENIKNIWVPHNLENIKKINPDYIIYSTAITNNNEELVWAKENKKTILHRSELLELATSGKEVISISGTHGKTSTSAMIAEMLIGCGLDPSAIIGGILNSKNTNTICGNGAYFVVEADESDKSFLKGNTQIAIITNIEPDHLENYPGGFEEIKDSFLKFAKKSISKKGLVVCMQDKVTREIITKHFTDEIQANSKKLITYGITQKCENTTISAKYNSINGYWDIYLRGNLITSVKLKVPGEHNVLNALAAFGVSVLLGLNPEKIKKSLESYKGVKRRFQILEGSKEFTVVDDYAHHPTEIVATIKATKELNPKRLIIVLQPHQPTRLRDLWDEFKEVLIKEESIIYVTDVYVARGSQIEGINSSKLVQEINKPNISYLPGNLDKITEYIKTLINPGDLILIMGAGNITNLGEKLLKSTYILTSNLGNN